MSNPTKSKTQNPTHFTPPMEIRCKSWQRFHGCSWDFVGLWCARNFQQVSLKNTSTPYWFEISDAHHAYNKPLSCTLQWSTKMLRQFNTKCIKGLQQINTTALEEEVFLLLVRASRQTSMPTPNNTNKGLLSSCTLKKHFIHHMKTRPFGEHKQGSGDNAYIKGKSWQEQKTNESSSCWTVATLVQNKPMRKKMTSSQPGSLDSQDLACWRDQQLLSSLLGNTLKRFRV